MHTTHGPSGRAYHHSSAGSDDDVIHFAITYEEYHLHGYVKRDVEVTLTMADVLRLAADHVRDRHIDSIEQATDREVLGLPEPIA